LSYGIRLVEASDACAIYETERTCFHDPYPREAFADLIKAHQGHFFVALDHGDIVGYAVASANATQGHVVSIAVDPRYRRRRIGTALLSALTAKLTEEGIRQMRLEVRKGNAGAIAFYERMGYRAFFEIRQYYADGEDALVLARSAESPHAFGSRVGPH